MIFDVVVIGASTAGLYAAEILAARGKKVALFDRAKELIPDRRTYIITPGLLRIVSDFDTHLIRHTIKSIQVQSGEEERTIRLSTPDFVIERRQLIDYFLSRAKKAGAEIFFDSEFLGFRTEKGKKIIQLRVEGQEKIIQTKYLIGADGVHSQVRELAGLHSVPHVPLLQAEVDLPSEWDSGLTKVWFKVDDSPYFYWLIPDKDNKAVVGLISSPGSNIRKLLDNFMKKNDLIPVEFQAGQAVMYTRKTRVEVYLQDLHILFVGDAAGQVKVTTVGGTVTGLAGAQAAARAILENKSYQHTLRKTNRELDVHYFIRSLLDKMSNHDYEILFIGLSARVQMFLKNHDRDQMRWHFWKLIYLQPKYIFLGSKILLRLVFSRK